MQKQHNCLSLLMCYFSEKMKVFLRRIKYPDEIKPVDDITLYKIESYIQQSLKILDSVSNLTLFYTKSCLLFHLIWTLKITID